MHMQEYDNSSNNVVVIGLGPIGLAAAIEACQAGLNVTAITDRPLGKQKGGYTRKPILLLNETSFEYLESLVGKNAVHAYLAKNKLEEFQFKQMNFNKNTTEIVTYYFISVHDLENLLYEKLKEYKKNNQIIIEEPPNQFTRIEKHAVIVQHPNRKEERIPFQYLIGADGSKHPSADKVGGIQYESTYDKSQTCTTHTAVEFSIDTDLKESLIPFVYPSPNQKRETLPFFQTNSKRPTMEEYLNVGWKLSSPPEARIFLAKHTLYVGTELPPNIFNLPNGEEKQEKILAWTKLVLRTILPPDKVETLTPKQYKNKKDVYQQEKQRKQITTFEVDLQQTNQAIVRLPQIPPSSENAYFLPVGDALHTPHYHLGTGVNDGLLQTKLLHELFKNKNIATYQLGVEKILAASNIRIQTYLDSRQKREDLATATKRQAASIKQFVTQLSTPFYEKRGPISKSFSPKKPKR